MKQNSISLLFNFSIIFSTFVATTLIANPVYASNQTICPNITTMDGSITLNPNEKILVCGTSKDIKSWKEIPTEQSILLLKNIASNLGYMNPRFETQGKEIKLWLGNLTRIKELEIVGNKQVLNPKKKRNVIGEPLVTEKLDEIEAWADLGIRSQGYACSKAKVEAHVWDGSVLVKTDLGDKKRFGDIIPDDMGGLNPSILKRYQPFNRGDIYDVRKSQIMTSRILSDGLMQSAYFVNDCTKEFVSLNLHTFVGKPKILRFGIGASTEEFPFLDISFKDARLDDNASSFITNLHLSPRKIEFSASSDLYKIPNSNKSYLQPRFSVSKEMEDVYTATNSKVGLDVGRKWDMWSTRWSLKGGPTYNYTNTSSGVGPTDVTYPSIDASLGLTSHQYEYSMLNQYEGWVSQFNYSGRTAAVESATNLNRYQFSIKQLWNVMDFSPPLFVLGTRVEATAVDVSEDNNAIDGDKIPTDDKVYIGGDDNLRGFSRKSINNNGLGYLTYLYVGFELRLIEELPYHLQPFLLFDSAKVGNKKFTLDDPIFLSQGVGLRWSSPIGTIRGSIAKGDIKNSNANTDQYKKEWVGFVSFGQEF